ncbi:MAG: N-acetylglucosamine-6-phosphate deacetylase [Kiritimatiellia bacterium]|nr:N-acetylglucosamine-6-phosphate deacetylase [Kiritimatiellia bacterium]
MLIRGAHVVTPGRDLGVTSVEVFGGKIVRMGDSPMSSPSGETLEADGLLLLPGFVDIHSHGRGGADFCDATDAAFEKIGRGKLADGVTSFLATGLTRPEEDLAELCRCAARYMAKCTVPTWGATCLGVHLEGPFFNQKMAGAQNPAYLRKPDVGFVDRLNAIAPVRKVSYAPELDGAIEFTSGLRARGIVASLGHSEADYDTFERARAAGATHLTHFCNAMMPIHHLRPSMVTGGMLADDVYAEIITDGVHLSDPMIRLIAKTKGPDRVMVITDAMCAAGEPDGIYSLGGLRVRVEKGRATLADVPYDPKAVVSNVAGSVALYPQCVKRWVRASGLPLEESVKALGFNQLRSLGIADRGDIKVGQAADLVLVDSDFEPQVTIVNGEIAWTCR